MQERAAQEKTTIVLFSAVDDAEVAIDGAAPVAVEGGKFKQLSVGPGEHELVIDGARKLRVKLEPFDRWAVPLVEEQCFMSLDVSLSHYSADDKKALGGPNIARRSQTSEPFEFPPNHYLVESELPANRTSANQTLLLRSLPCSEIDRLQSGLSDQGSEPTATNEPG